MTGRNCLIPIGIEKHMMMSFTERCLLSLIFFSYVFHSCHVLLSMFFIHIGQKPKEYGLIIRALA